MGFIISRCPMERRVSDQSEKFYQSAAHRVHPRIRDSKIHFSVRPCSASDAIGFKGLMNGFIPFQCIFRRSAVNDPVFSAVQSDMTLFCHFNGFLKSAQKIFSTKRLIRVHVIKIMCRCMPEGLCMSPQFTHRLLNGESECMIHALNPWGTLMGKEQRIMHSRAIRFHTDAYFLSVTSLSSSNARISRSSAK